MDGSKLDYNSSLFNLNWAANYDICSVLYADYQQKNSSTLHGHGCGDTVHFMCSIPCDDEGKYKVDEHFSACIFSKPLILYSVFCPWDHPFPMAGGLVCCKFYNSLSDTNVHSTCDGSHIGYGHVAECCINAASVPCKGVACQKHPNADGRCIKSISPQDFLQR